MAQRERKTVMATRQPVRTLVSFCFVGRIWINDTTLWHGSHTQQLHHLPRQSCIVSWRKWYRKKYPYTSLESAYKNATLLNDDSPILRVENGTVWAYGSPWSGKTPCYKSERHELKACVRLSQAPYNRITKLSVLHAYGAIHPSCPPEFAYDNNLYSHVSDFIGKLLSEIPFYHLSCLPNKEAALLSCRTIFQVEIWNKFLMISSSPG